MRIAGARQNNLKNIDLSVPRDALVVFTGVSGSGKSSLAFGTLYAESQRRYLESVAPYARRLIDQAGVPDVDSITGMPPAVALQQARGAGGSRSTVGSITTLSSLVRMLYSRAGEYPDNQDLLLAEEFSTNTVQGACPECHGIGKVYDVAEEAMVPDPTLTLRERAIASWPTAWHGQQLRDTLVSLGYDVDVPWQDLPKEQRDWILYTEQTPSVPVYSRLTLEESQQAAARGDEPNYTGTYVGARKYVLDTFANTKSASMKKKVSRFLTVATCPLCRGKKLKPEALTVTFGGLDIADFSALPLREALAHLNKSNTTEAGHRLIEGLIPRITPIVELGLGYLSLDRTTPTLSGGELQRLRLATQLTSDLFGVVYVLDEPSSGLHPQDISALMRILEGLKARGNSLFVVEHNVEIMRQADWLVDIGPAAGERGGRVVHSGPPEELKHIAESATRGYMFGGAGLPPHTPRTPAGWLELQGVHRNNVQGISARFPIGAMIAVTGVSGSGKSSLVSQALPELVLAHLPGTTRAASSDDPAPRTRISCSRRIPARPAASSAVTSSASAASSPLIRSPSAAHLGLMWPRTRVFLILCDAATPQPPPPSNVVLSREPFPSMSRAVAARTVTARVT